MTDDQWHDLEKKLHQFKSFYELHSYANQHQIVFDAEDWEYFSEKFTEILEKKTKEDIYIDTTGLILP